MDAIGASRALEGSGIVVVWLHGGWFVVCLLVVAESLYRRLRGVFGSDDGDALFCGGWLVRSYRDYGIVCLMNGGLFNGNPGSRAQYSVFIRVS